MNGLKIEIEERHGVVLVRITGRLDASSSPVLEKKLEPHIAAKKKLLLDFHGVDYLSSAGMRLLLSATKKLKALEGHLAICSMNEEVMEIITMAGFERILHIYPGEAEALLALK